MNTSDLYISTSLNSSFRNAAKPIEVEFFASVNVVDL